MKQSIKTVTVGSIPATHPILTRTKNRIPLSSSTVKRNSHTRKLFLEIGILCPYLSCAHELSQHCSFLLQFSMCYFWGQSSSAENIWIPCNQWNTSHMKYGLLRRLKKTKLMEDKPMHWVVIHIFKSCICKMGRKFHSNRLLCLEFLWCTILFQVIPPTYRGCLLL